MKLGELIKQERFNTPAQEAMLNVLVTASWIDSVSTTMMAPFGVTPAQYNVLRILRGSDPNALTCSAIGERLLDRTPDVTRLLDRLERSGFITRVRSDLDRRVVQVNITQEGKMLLERLDPEVYAMIDRLFGQLTTSQQLELTALLETVRTEQTV